MFYTQRPARPTWDGEGGAVPPVEMLLYGVQGGIVQLLLEGGEARLVLGDVVDHRHHRAHRILHQLNTQHNAWWFAVNNYRQ